MISLLVLYVILIIFVIIFNFFGKSLESVQYYHHKLMFELEWDNEKPLWVHGYSQKNSLILLKCCVFGSILQSQGKESLLFMYVPCFFKRIFSIDGLSWTRDIQRVGYMATCDDFFIISLFSTSNISDVLFSTNNKLIDIDDGQVHEGYYVHTFEFLGCVLRNLKCFPSIKKLFITGHSMGGSLGSILGYILNKFFLYDVKIYTFGSPKFGNNQMKHYIQKSKNIEIWNVINSADLVPYKPSNWKYTRIGKTIKHRIDTGNDNVNHGIKVYREIVLRKEKSAIAKRPHRIDEIISRFFLDILG